MNTPVGQRFNVSQTYSRNVDQVDSRHAGRTGGQNLRSAPNQDIAGGTIGRFKSSASFFRDSIKGFFEAPMGKKVAFLQDRVELRSMQKQEVAQQQRFDREDRAIVGDKFKAPAYNNPLACKILQSGTKHSAASLRVTLGEWSSKVNNDAKANGTSIASERQKIANHLMTSLTDENWKDIDKPALKRLENELRAQGRHDQADMMGAINDMLATTMTQANAQAKFHFVASSYIANFDKPVVEFWRNNHSGGELELKALVCHGFMNPFKEAVFKEFEPSLQTDAYQKLSKAPQLSSKTLTEEQAGQVRVLAEKLFEALETATLTQEMLSTLAQVRDDITNSRGVDDRDDIMKKFFLNSSMLKGVNIEMERLGDTGRCTAMMVYETFFNRDQDTPFGRQVSSLRDHLGDRLDNMLHRLGMP